MASRDDDAKARREAARKALPPSFSKLPWMEYRQRAAQTSEEYLSDVEFGVQGPSDLHRRFATRFPKPKK